MKINKYKLVNNLMLVVVFPLLSILYFIGTMYSIAYNGFNSGTFILVGIFTVVYFVSAGSILTFLDRYYEKCNKERSDLIEKEF